MDILSVESMNVILSSYAERGDYYDVDANLQLMKEMGINPNEDSFSFAMEALGKHLLRTDRKSRHTIQEDILGNADNVLVQMEEYGISPNVHIVRNYIELLCLAGEVATATNVVNSCIETGSRSSVNNKTLYRVAMANVNDGNYDAAVYLSSLMTESMPVLDRKIQELKAGQETNSIQGEMNEK